MLRRNQVVDGVRVLAHEAVAETTVIEILRIANHPAALHEAVGIPNPLLVVVEDHVVAVTEMIHVASGLRNTEKCQHGTRRSKA